MKVITTIYDKQDEAIEVTGIYSPARKGARDRWGAPIEPDEESGISILSAIDCDGDEIELDEEQELQALKCLWSEI